MNRRRRRTRTRRTTRSNLATAVVAASSQLLSTGRATTWNCYTHNGSARIGA
jgi:hypothetical protein